MTGFWTLLIFGPVCRSPIIISDQTIRKITRATRSMCVFYFSASSNARINGIAGEGQIVFTTRGPNLISANHTEAPETMRGTGGASALVEHMIADARANHFKIIPVCPYVKAQYKRHAEWSEVMTIDPPAMV